MGLKIFIGFIIFYFSSITYLTLFEKKFVKKDLFNKNEIPLIEFKDIKNFHIDKKGVDTIIKAKEALRFQDHDEIREANILTFQRGKKESLKAKQANYKNDIIYLYGNIQYENEEGLKLFSNKMVYKLKEKILSSQTPFTLISKKAKIEGDSFVYNRQKGIIKALKIKAIIKETKKL